ncbi:MAG: hypothetical protein J6Y08_04010 [Clostridiales bacterium]|nr:hypothetical protein [Clostridiales bacterium]
MARTYLDNLKSETNWFRIFRPLFIVLTIIIELFTPLVLYICQVLILHQKLNLPSFWYGLGVSMIFSAFVAWIISEKNRKAQTTR